MAEPVQHLSESGGPGDGDGISSARATPSAMKKSQFPFCVKLVALGPKPGQRRLELGERIREHVGTRDRGAAYPGGSEESGEGKATFHCRERGRPLEGAAIRGARGAVAQLVEPRVMVPVVAGSNPVRHPYSVAHSRVRAP